MASVTVYDKDKIDALVGETVVDAVIDGTGDLILTTQAGGTINVGNVIADHGDLTGLADDDHSQYALANGARGNFASATQGAKADAARVNTGSEILIDGNDGASEGTVETVTITDDGTPTSGWLSRLVYRFKESVGATARNTFYLNEYGEIRVAPAKLNTTALRVFVKEFPSNPSGTRDATAPVVELMDDRTNRNSLWALRGDGTMTRNGIPVSQVLVLSAAASVPAGTPANTVIFRTT